MCGITGIINKNGKHVSETLIKDLTDVIAHRGPDGDGFYIDRNIALGHRRLSIIDLSNTGKQPMLNENADIALTYNGEVYNYIEIKKELQSLGHQFFSTSDTEVILRGYEQWGLDIIPKLNGMFALAIWDSKKQCLTITRDRYGIKPLYVWIRDHQVVFASEIKSILKHPEYKIAVNYETLNEYFTFQNVFRFHTLFDQIQLLAPARVMQWDSNLTLKEYSYWNFNFSEVDNTISKEDATNETLRLFQQSVKRQMVADVRVGAYLSGGMDSGSIVANAVNHTSRLATFTCGFDMNATSGREANFDERRDAELMSAYFKTEHYEQVLNSSDLSWVIPKLVYHLEDLRIGMSYPNYYISGLASKFVKVCLSGAGGDELYGGYPWRYYRTFKSVNKNEYFKEYYGFWQRLVGDDDKQNLFNATTFEKINKEKSSFDIFKNVFLYNENLSYNSPEDHISNSLYFEAKTFLPAIFLVGDKLGMAHSLEERFPFMDNDLVDFAQKIPVRHKLGNLEAMKLINENELSKIRKFESQFDDGKNVLRNAMRQLLPEQIINRKKQGFSAPDESWYRGENLQYVKKILLDKNAAYLEFINLKYVERIIHEHSTKNINHRLLIWSFLCFEWWCRIFLRGEKIN